MLIPFSTGFKAEKPRGGKIFPAWLNITLEWLMKTQMPLSCDYLNASWNQPRSWFFNST